MEFNFNGTYSKIYKKYHKEIIGCFCKGMKQGEISNELKREYEVKLSPQAINVFYYNNKEYIDNCVHTKKMEKIEDFKDACIDEILIERLGTYFYLITDDLPSLVENMTYDEKIKNIPIVANAISKLLGKDQSNVNVNNHSIKELEEIFKDDINWE